MKGNANNSTQSERHSVQFFLSERLGSNQGSFCNLSNSMLPTKNTFHNTTTRFSSRWPLQWIMACSKNQTHLLFLENTQGIQMICHGKYDPQILAMPKISIRYKLSCQKKSNDGGQHYRAFRPSLAFLTKSSRSRSRRTSYQVNLITPLQVLMLLWWFVAAFSLMMMIRGVVLVVVTRVRGVPFTNSMTIPWCKLTTHQR